MAIKSINPFNNQLIHEFDEHTDQQIDAAIAKADEAFRSWKDSSFAARSEVLTKAANLMRQRREHFAHLASTEMGKLLKEARDEVDLSADILDYYAKNGEKMLASRKLEVSEGEALIAYDPIGVIFGIEPWNFPYYQVVRIAAPNIMTGNTVIIKHASLVPQCGIVLEQLFQDAGAPEGVYTNLLISSEKAARVIADPRVQGVSLTGSAGAGAKVAAEAGKHLKKSVLELGGNDAFIVLDDADIDMAVEAALWAKMYNTGQCCTAAKRYIVVESIADKFIDQFTQKMASLAPGDPLQEDTTLAPLSSEEAAKQLQQQLDESVSMGAKVLLGGKRFAREGAFMEPTVLVDIKPGMPAYDQELFGPVASIFRVANEEEAIRLANDSIYGLGGSVYSKDVQRAQKLARRLDTGMVFVNQPTTSTPELPFGGTKHSGYGRELSDLGIMEFVNKKLVHVGTGAAAHPG